MIRIAIFDASILVIAGVSSLHFVSRFIESDQDPSQVKLSRYIFSSTFSLCILLLLLFLQEVWAAFPVQASLVIWRTLFIVMAGMLLLIIPCALIRDLFCAKHVVTTRKRNLKFFGLFLLGFLAMDAFIFDKFIERDLSATSTEVLWHAVTLMATALSAQMEFLTLTGIIFNAMMQGYVCSNSIYVFLIENIHQNLKTFAVETDGDIEGQTHSYHQNRIAAVSQSITDTKSKQTLLEQQL